MKNILFLIALGASYITYAQTLSYNDIGVLFTKENIDGTARFNAMSGAFGALGGDLSSIGNNPAGAAVFLKSEAAFTLDFNGIDTYANYYGTPTYSESDVVNFSQAGGVFVYKNRYSNSKNTGWGKMAFAFDYSKVNDYKNFWYAKGNSGYSPITDFYDPEPIYINAENQYFENYNEGRNNKFSFTFASQYENKLYVGASFNSYNIDYYQNVFIEEYNNDGNSNTFDVFQAQKLLTFGNGYSFGLGLIAKPIKSIRLGFAYQSPVWYSLAEESVDYDVSIYENDINITNEFDEDDTYSGLNRFSYNLRTPSRYTTSFAYIFDKFGLISIDYIYKNYSNINISSVGFGEDNENFRAYLKGVNEVRIGTEWRLNKASIRGGYHFEQNPYKNAISSDDVQGYSAGLGYNFGKVKFDIAYMHSSNTAPYNFYPKNNEVQQTELEFKNNRFTATLVLSL